MRTTTAYEATKEQVLSIAAPPDTNTYKAISHAMLINLTLEAIAKAGFRVQSETYTMARNGDIANGRYTIRDFMDKEMQIQVIWQNSLDKSMTLKWGMGIHVFVCSNGAISGDMGAFRRKHTGIIQTFTPQAISEYVLTAGEVFSNTQKERDMMKSITVNRRTAAELLGRMYVEEGFIQSTQLNLIVDEMKKPTYDYGAPGSLWELYQFTTYAMRGTHPEYWMQNHIEAHHFFTSQAEILVPKVIIPVDSPSTNLSWLSGTIRDISHQPSLFDQEPEVIVEEEPVIEEEPIVEPLPMKKYMLIIMSDDPDLEGTEDPHQKYRVDVEATDEQEATRVGLEKFDMEHPGAPVHWTKIYNL